MIDLLKIDDLESPSSDYYGNSLFVLEQETDQEKKMKFIVVLGRNPFESLRKSEHEWKVISVGRGEENDITISNISVSRCHADLKVMKVNK